MTIQKFIDKAIKGGCIGFAESKETWSGMKVYSPDFMPYSLFLDPRVWQAVGKVEGFDEGLHVDKSYSGAPITMPMWQWKMHRMIDALAEGKTIEEFIATL